MITRNKVFILLYISYLAPLMGFAQQFKYSAQLDSVTYPGFYAIAISPELSACIKTDFADIRIADENKQWVPHILQASKAISKDQFTPFPIVENTLTDSGKNLLVIENTKVAGISNLQIFLKNSAVSRTAAISGSINRHDWFIIDDHLAIGRSYEMEADEYLQEINFPLSKFRYFKIVIDNVHNDPLLITKAGSYAQPSYKKPAGYLDNPVPAFTQKDSIDMSFIEVRQRINYHFDKIMLDISGPKFYDRTVQICLPDFGKNQVAKPGKVLGSFKLLSALPPIFELPRNNIGLFFILIKNADNPPLKIEKVITQQQPFSLVAYLEQGKRYELLLGDSLASPADYDLQAFKDSIDFIRSLNYRNIHTIKRDIAEKPSTNKNYWIWPLVIFAGIVLSFLTYRLTGDIDPSKK